MAASGRGEMAYAAGLGPVGGDTVGVQIPPPAPKSDSARKIPPAIASLDKLAAELGLGNERTVMSFRSTVSAIAITAAACVLLAPAAMASSGPVQVTGHQLKSALLPASDFLAGYTVGDENDSGRQLEHRTVFKIGSLNCRNFWLLIGTVGGFGESAYAGDLIDTKSTSVTVFETFNQAVYQFASTHAAASFYRQLNAKYRSCRTVTSSDGNGGSIRRTVRSQSKQRVGGHQAVRLVESVSFSKVPGPPLVIYVLWTIDGTDVYTISTTPLSIPSPKPAQASLTLKLIARVSHLR
jgi:PknH-like extracellular domain